MITDTPTPPARTLIDRLDAQRNQAAMRRLAFQVCVLVLYINVLPARGGLATGRRDHVGPGYHRDLRSF